MESINLNKFFNELSGKTLSQLIAGLATVAIVSMDLGVNYNDQERKIYTSLIFQCLAVFSVGYLFAEDINQGIVLLLVWGMIKYSTKLIKIKTN